MNEIFMSIKKKKEREKDYNADELNNHGYNTMNNERKLAPP